VPRQRSIQVLIAIGFFVGCRAPSPPVAAPVATAHAGPPGCFSFDSAYFTVDIIDMLAMTRGSIDTRRVTSHILALGGPPRDTNPLARSMDELRARPVDIPTIGPLPPTAVRTQIGNGWYPISGETILLRWGSALTFHLTVTGDSLVGTWGIYSDQIITPESPRQPIPTRPASAVRVECPRADGASSVAPARPSRGFWMPTLDRIGKHADLSHHREIPSSVVAA